MWLQQGAFSAGFLLILWAVGLAPARLLPERLFRARLVAAPVFGFAAVAVLIAAGYRRDIPLAALAYVVLALAAVGLLFEGWRLSRRGSTGVGEGFAVVATTLVVLILCLAPAWIGGARFAAVQGNQWDQFSYLSVAALAKRMSYSAYNSAQLWPFLAASTAH